MEHNSSVALRSSSRLGGAAVKRPHITDALRRTFFEEWARVGYSALSLDLVARKAGVGKAALYRRWRSKADMAADLVREMTGTAVALMDTGDQGSLEADLLAALLVGRRILRHPLVRRIVPDLYIALSREPALAAAIRPGEMARERKVEALIGRAIARGELPADVDRRIASDLLVGPLYWSQIVLNRRYDRQQLRTLVDMTAAAIVHHRLALPVGLPPHR